jgi:antitoxin component of MazEF toxin-antitoxin module
MNTTIISIGNSKGVRIPKPLLKESGLGKEVNLIVKNGEIRIIAIKTKPKISETALLSEKVLAKDWLRPEEDKAWASLK